MKTIITYFGISLMLTVLLVGCSKKISNDRIDKLEGREALLKKTTELNELKIELEKNIVKHDRLVKDVEKINREASASARESQNLSQRVSRNPGEAGLASKAEKAARRAAKDAKKAGKLNTELGDVNKKISNLRKDIDKAQRELSELEAKVEFVPNNQ